MCQRINSLHILKTPVGIHYKAQFKFLNAFNSIVYIWIWINNTIFSIISLAGIQIRWPLAYQADALQIELSRLEPNSVYIFCTIFLLKILFRFQISHFFTFLSLFLSLFPLFRHIFSMNSISIFLFFLLFLVFLSFYTLSTATMRKGKWYQIILQCFASIHFSLLSRCTVGFPPHSGNIFEFCIIFCNFLSWVSWAFAIFNFLWDFTSSCPYGH